MSMSMSGGGCRVAGCAVMSGGVAGWGKSRVGNVEGKGRETETRTRTRTRGGRGAGETRRTRHLRRAPDPVARSLYSPVQPFISYVVPVRVHHSEFPDHTLPEGAQMCILDFNMKRGNADIFAFWMLPYAPDASVVDMESFRPELSFELFVSRAIWQGGLLYVLPTFSSL